MTINKGGRAMMASFMLSVFCCIVWLVPRDQGNMKRLAVDDSRGHLSHISHRLLFNTLDEEELVPELFPFQAADYVGLFASVLVLLMAAAAGIGGGGLLTPIFILIFGFHVKHSIALTAVTVLGGAMANNLLNARKRHPEYLGRPAIDWDLILQLEPMTIGGTLIGADLNVVLPDLVLVIFLFLLLSVTAYKTLLNARKLHQKEIQAENAQQQQESAALMENGTTKAEEENDYGSTTFTKGSNGQSSHSAHQSFGLEQIRECWIAAAKLTALFALVTALNLLKGGSTEGGEHIGLETCGSKCFWITTVAMYTIIIGFAVWVRNSTLHRVRSGGVLLSEMEWDEDNTIRYPVYAIGAGLVVGTCGVGGGIIIAPLMLAMGVHPAVASASTACMILYSSATATISYMLLGLVIADYAIGCLVIGFVVTLVGQVLMDMILKKYNRNSYIAYAIGILVGLSAIAMTVESVHELVG